MIDFNRIVQVFNLSSDNRFFTRAALTVGITGGGIPGRWRDYLIFFNLGIFDVNPVTQSAPGSLQQAVPLTVRLFAVVLVIFFPAADRFLEPLLHQRYQISRSGQTRQLSDQHVWTVLPDEIHKQRIGGDDHLRQRSGFRRQAIIARCFGPGIFPALFAAGIGGGFTVKRVFAALAVLKPCMRYIFRYFFLIKRLGLKLMEKPGFQKLSLFSCMPGAGVFRQIQRAEADEISAAPAHFFQTGCFAKSQIKSEITLCV